MMPTEGPGTRVPSFLGRTSPRTLWKSICTRRWNTASMPKGERFYEERFFYGYEEPAIDTLETPLVIQVAPTGSFIRREIEFFVDEIIVKSSFGSIFPGCRIVNAFWPCPVDSAHTHRAGFAGGINFTILQLEIV